MDPPSLVLYIALMTIQASNAKHIYHDFNIGYFCGAPDGVYVCHILGVNGQYPGPTIEGAIGDTLHVNVRNLITQFDRPQTSIHWHGLFQNGTPFADGPENITQCGISQFTSMNYEFKLEQSGTFWWHSHVGDQYTEGLWGPLVIHNKPEVYAKDYDDELIITLSDWYHTSGKVNINWHLSPASRGDEPIPFSHLINGRGKYHCNATKLLCLPLLQRPKEFRVTRGKRYRIRVINSAAFAKFHFSIPGHKLETIEVDGIDTVKRTFDRVPIGAGQRYSFIVVMNATGNSHWIKAEADLTMYKFSRKNINPNPQDMIPIVYAKLTYIRPLRLPFDFDNNENAGPPPPQPQIAANGKDGFQEMTLQPYDGVFAPKHVDQEVILVVEGYIDAQGVAYLTFNRTVYSPGDIPLLALVLKNQSLPTSSNPVTIGYQKVVQIVLNNHDIDNSSHPFHLHGHAFWVLGKGLGHSGDYNASSDVLVLDGVKRDTVEVENHSWVVIRFIADNPGVWFFHCHVDWHLEAGLAMVFNEAPEQSRQRFTIPEYMKQTCANVGVKL